MRDQNEEFVVVALSREEFARMPRLELQLLRAAEKGLLAGSVPTILVCDDLDGPILGFGSSSRVFFFNDAAWGVCRAAGIFLNATRTIQRSDLPTKYILLVGPASESSKEELNTLNVSPSSPHKLSPDRAISGRPRPGDGVRRFLRLVVR